MNFNWFDLVLCLVMLSSIISGLRSGFARVVVGLATTCFGLLAGFWFYRMLSPSLLPYIRSQTAANMLSFLIILVGVLLLGSLLAALLSSVFSWVGLSWFNHLLGGLGGAVRGALAVAALVAVVIAFTPSPLPDFLNHSQLVPRTAQLSGWLADLAPRELKDAFNQQIEALQDLWSPKQKHAAQKEI